MNRIFKFLMIWFLLLAVPMQGYAAATMLNCGSTHRHEMLALDAAAHQQDAATHAHAAQHHDAAPEATATDTVTPDGYSGKHDKTSCSACAACCVAAAVIPSGLSWTPPYSRSESPFAVLAVSFSGYIPAGLERPPRFILA